MRNWLHAHSLQKAHALIACYGKARFRHRFLRHHVSSLSAEAEYLIPALQDDKSPCKDGQTMTCRTSST